MGHANKWEEKSKYKNSGKQQRSIPAQREDRVWLRAGPSAAEKSDKKRPEVSENKSRAYRVCIVSSISFTAASKVLTVVMGLQVLMLQLTLTCECRGHERLTVIINLNGLLEEMAQANLFPGK